MNDMTHPIEAVRTLVAQDLFLGEPVTCRGLTLVPLSAMATVAKTGLYALAAEAIAAGTLVIEETGGGQVPQLVVHNQGDLPVLLVEGEHLEGAMQDRVLNVSVLVAARHDTHIPVSCVEHGRWGYRGSQRFAPAPEFTQRPASRPAPRDQVATSDATGGPHARRMARLHRRGSREGYQNGDPSCSHRVVLVDQPLIRSRRHCVATGAPGGSRRTAIEGCRGGHGRPACSR